MCNQAVGLVAAELERQGRLEHGVLAQRLTGAIERIAVGERHEESPRRAHPLGHLA